MFIKKKRCTCFKDFNFQYNGYFCYCGSGIRLGIPIHHIIEKLACLDIPVKNFMNNVASGKDVDCWQEPFLKMAMLKVKEDMK